MPSPSWLGILKGWIPLPSPLARAPMPAAWPASPCAAAQWSLLPCHLKTQCLNLLCPLLISRFLFYCIYALSTESWGIDKSSEDHIFNHPDPCSCSSNPMMGFFKGFLGQAEAPQCFWRPCRVSLWPPILRNTDWRVQPRPGKCSICHSILGVAQLAASGGGSQRAFPVALRLTRC